MISLLITLKAPTMLREKEIAKLLIETNGEENALYDEKLDSFSY